MLQGIDETESIDDKQSEEDEEDGDEEDEEEVINYKDEHLLWNPGSG